MATQPLLHGHGVVMQYQSLECELSAIRQLIDSGDREMLESARCRLSHLTTDLNAEADRCAQRYGRRSSLPFLAHQQLGQLQKILDETDETRDKVDQLSRRLSDAHLRTEHVIDVLARLHG